MPPAPSSSAPHRRTRLRLLERLARPIIGRRIYAVVLLTLKAAVRFRLIQVLLVLLLAAILGLPAIIKHDGTAEGFTQILITYTLGSITILLGFATLWLGCGTLARDVEECQMQVVAVKPVRRWEIWLGKWLGIVALNAALLAVAGATVYLLIQWRARQLPPALQSELHEKIFIARRSVKPLVNYASIREAAERVLEQRLKDPSIAAMDRNFVRTNTLAEVKASLESVLPRRSLQWVFQLGPQARTQTLTVRTKFFSANGSSSGTYYGWWAVGPLDGRRYEPEEMSLAPETFHEFPVPAGLIDDQGRLIIDFANPNDTALVFPLEGGLEVLYPEGAFAPNFARGLGIILCWLALLAAIGLAAGSFLSFPVAAFCALGLLILGASTTTLKQVVDEGGISAVNPNSGHVDEPILLDHVAVPISKGLLWLIQLVRGFSPVDALSTGRTIPWSDLGKAGGQIVLILAGLFAAFGITMFNRRELATAQGP